MVYCAPTLASAPGTVSTPGTAATVRTGPPTESVGAGSDSFYIVKQPVQILPSVSTEADLQQLAEESPEDLISYVDMRGISLGLRACAVDALAFLADKEWATVECVRAFHTEELVLQEAALGSLERIHTGDALRFIRTISGSTACHAVIAEIAQELIDDDR